MKPKIALVGVGRFGKNHLKNLIELDKKRKIEFKGIIDSDKDLIRVIKKEYKINTASTIEEFARDVDAFDVVTPPRSHYNIVRKILEHEKDVFVEKPLTLFPSEANQSVYSEYLPTSKPSAIWVL